MTKDWRVFADHVLEGIERIRDFRQRAEAGKADPEMAFLAILRLLETVCEAASDKLPDEIKDRYFSVDWKAIRGMRIRLAHAYLSIDPAVIESTIARDLDPLYEAMKREVPDWDARRNRKR